MARSVTRLLAAAFALVLASGCTSSSDPGARPTDGAEGASTSASPSPEAAGSPTPSPTPTPSAPPHPISVPALAEAEHSGDRLRLGAVREETATFTSYDVTYRSRTTSGRGTRTLTISGVLNVPKGTGPFPAVVLAHGYIEPSAYVRGQGMTRERGYLADRGFIALHVDYRNHAESTDDRRVSTAVRLGYASDVINAVHALRTARDVPVDGQRIAYFGRSMGGGVVMKALVAEPGLVQAGIAWASVSSLEAENFRHFNADDPGDDGDRQRMARRHGLPQESPAFWRGLSPRPFFELVEEPVLLVHGRRDDTCPPRWARATQRAMQRAGVESRLAWYEDGHAFGPAFNAAMDRTIRFLRSTMGG